MSFVSLEFMEDSSAYSRKSSYKKKGVTERQRYSFLLKLSSKQNTYRCPCCYSIITEKNYHIGHVKPERHGGANEFENYVAMCPHCNEEMHDKFFQPEDISEMFVTEEDIKTILFFGGKNNNFYSLLAKQGLIKDDNFLDLPIPQI